jgi:hypothetical protein
VGERGLAIVACERRHLRADHGLDRGSLAGPDFGEGGLRGEHAR